MRLDEATNIVIGTEPPLCVIDLDGFVWPTVGSTGQPVGRVASAPHEGGVAEVDATAEIVAFLDKIAPGELERHAMARCGMGDGPNAIMRHALDALKQLAGK